MKRARGSYEGLTAKQAELLSFLRNERDAGRTPSFEEMKVATGLASKSGVNRLLLGLVERGYVDRTLNRARAIRVYDVASIARTADPLVNIDLTAIPMTALLGEIARRTNGQVRV